MTHLDDNALSAYIDGGLFGPQRVKVERHLSVCADCTRRLVEATRVIARLGLSQPIIPHHFLEVILSYLKYYLRLPYWASNFLFYIITFTVVWFIPSTRTDWWGTNWLGHALRQFSEALAATYFFWSLKQIRGLPALMSSIGLPPKQLEKFTMRWIAPIYGWIDWKVGSVHLRLNTRQTTLLFAGSYIILWGMGALSRGYTVLTLLPLIYFLIVKAAWGMGCIFYLFALAGLIRLLEGYLPQSASLENENFRSELRSLVQNTAFIGSIATTAWLVGTIQLGRPLIFWGPVLSVFLLLVILGHLYYERYFFGASSPFRWQFQKHSEAVVTIGVIASACLPGAISIAYLMRF